LSFATKKADFEKLKEKKNEIDTLERKTEIYDGIFRVSHLCFLKGISLKKKFRISRTIKNISSKFCRKPKLNLKI
jgi:hypothetical protein